MTADAVSEKSRKTYIEQRLKSDDQTWAPRMHMDGHDGFTREKVAILIEQHGEFPRLWRRVTRMQRSKTTTFEFFIDGHPVEAASLEHWAELLEAEPSQISWTVLPDKQMQGQREMLEETRRFDREV